jgi:hypothetical protein
MDKTVAELNIQHFKQLLETEADPVKKQTIQPQWLPMRTMEASLRNVGVSPVT